MADQERINQQEKEYIRDLLTRLKANLNADATRTDEQGAAEGVDVQQILHQAEQESSAKPSKDTGEHRAAPSGRQAAGVKGQATPSERQAAQDGMAVPSEQEAVLSDTRRAPDRGAPERVAPFTSAARQAGAAVTEPNEQGATATAARDKLPAGAAVAQKAAVREVHPAAAEHENQGQARGPLSRQGEGASVAPQLKRRTEDSTSAESARVESARTKSAPAEAAPAETVPAESDRVESPPAKATTTETAAESAPAMPAYSEALGKRKGRLFLFQSAEPAKAAGDDPAKTGTIEAIEVSPPAPGLQDFASVTETVPSVRGEHGEGTFTEVDMSRLETLQRTDTPDKNKENGVKKGAAGRDKGSSGREGRDAGRDKRRAAIQRVQKRQRLPADEAYFDEQDPQAGLEKLRKECRRRLVGLIVQGALCVLLVLLTYLPAWRQGLPARMGLARVGGVWLLFDLQLLLIAAGVAWRPLYRSLRRLGRGLVDIWAPAWCGLCLSSAMTLYQYFAHVGHAVYYGLPAALLLLVPACFELLSVRGVYQSATDWLAQKEGLCATLGSTKEYPGLQQGEEASAKVLIQTQPRTEQDSGFLAQLNVRYDEWQQLRFPLIVALVMAASAAVVAWFADGGVLSALHRGLSTCLMALPLSAAFLHRYTFARLRRLLAKHGLTVAGERAVREYARVGVMTFADTDAFPIEQVQVRKIKLCGENRLDKVMGYLSALFGEVGGPLQGVFRTDTPNPPAVLVSEVAEDGLAAVIDGVAFLAGRGTYMERKGINFYYDSDDEGQIERGDVRIMFTAVEGQPCAKLYLAYGIRAGFVKYAEQLDKQHIYPVLKTADPNMTEKLLDRLTYLSVCRIGLLHRQTADGENPSGGGCRTGLFSRGGRVRDLYHAALLFKGYRTTQKRLRYLSVILTILAGGLGVLLAAFVPSFTAYALPAVVCQVASLVPPLLFIEAAMMKHKIGKELT